MSRIDIWIVHFWGDHRYFAKAVCVCNARALATSPAPCCRRGWCLLLGPGEANKPEEEPAWKSVSALKRGQKVSSVCHGHTFLPLVGFLEVVFIFLFSSPVSPLGACPGSLTWHIWVETGAFWFAGSLEEMIAAPFPVPSRGKGTGGRAGTSCGRYASTARAGQRCGIKSPTDLFQGGGRAVLCHPKVVLLPFAPRLQGCKASPSPNCIPTP